MGKSHSPYFVCRRLLAVVLMFALLVPVTLATFTSCYLYRNDVSDLTFTYNFNVARIAAHARLIQDLSIDLKSNAYPNFDQSRNFTASFESLVNDDRCNLIVATSPTMLTLVADTFAVRYPNVMFVARVSDDLPDDFPPNFSYFTVSMFQGLFRAGAVASQYVTGGSGSCIGFIATRLTRSWEPNSLYAGMSWANRTSSVALLAVSLEDDTSAEAETMAADLLVAKGCEVIVSVTSNNVLPTYIANAYPDVSTIGYAADSALTAGDSVLSSVYSDLQYFFYNMTIDAINATMPASYLLNMSTEVVLAELSPRSSVSLVSVAEAVKRYADAHDVSCLSFVDRYGVAHSNECVNSSNRDQYPYLNSQITFMPAFRSPLLCGAGYYASYDVSTLALTCNVCPANTYTSRAGLESCLPCETGLAAPVGSSGCSVPSNSSFELLLIIPIVIGSLAVVIVSGAIIASLFRVRVASSLDPRNAPPGPQVAMAMLGVDGARSDRQWRHSLTNMCDVYDQLAAIVSSVANDHKGYIFLSVGDVFMLAMNEPTDLVQLLGHVQERATRASWPCAIRLKMALHYGTPNIGESQSRKVAGGDDDKRKTYTGAEVDVLRSIWKKEIAETYDVVLSGKARENLEAKGLGGVNGESAILYELQEPLAFTSDDGDVSLHTSDLRFIMRQQHHQGDGDTSASSMTNPLSVAMPQLDATTNTTGENDARSGATPSETSETVDDDLTRLVTPSAISKEELDALRSLGVDLLQKFIRVFSFDDQVSIVTAISKKLHVQSPQIPEMKTSAKKSFNVLRNSLRQICSQLLLSMDEMELHSWLDGVAAHINNDGRLAGEDTQAVRAPALS